MTCLQDEDCRGGEAGEGVAVRPWGGREGAGEWG